MVMGAGTVFRFSAERKNLSAIRDFVESQMAEAGAGQKNIDDLIQAVDEAATNIIVHGYRDLPGWIEVEVRVTRRTATVILRDQAPTFHPDEAPRPDLTLPLHKRPVGGLGVYLMRKCVDELKHNTPEGGGNELFLVKRLEEDS